MAVIPSPSHVRRSLIAAWLVTGMILSLALRAQGADKPKPVPQAQPTARERQLADSLRIFSHDVTRLHAEKGFLTRIERWENGFGGLDMHFGHALGTTAKELPEFAKRILGEADTPDLYRAYAYFVLKQFDQAEKAALKQSEFKGDDVLVTMGWQVAGEVALEKSQPDLAIERFRKALALCDPARHVNQWIVMQTGVMRALQMQGDGEGQLEALREISEQSFKHHGPSSSITHKYQDQLANVYYKLGRFAEAEKQYRALIKSLEKEPEKASMQMKVLRDNLARCVAAQEPKEETAGKTMPQTTPPGGKVAARTETNAMLRRRDDLATRLYGEKKYAEAAAQWRIVYESYLQQHGPESQRTQMIQNNLAVALHYVGDHEESARLLKSIIAIRESKVPDDDLGLLENRNNLANALRGLNRYKEAELQHRWVAKARARVLGMDHPKTLDAHLNLLGDLRDLKRLDEAETMARQVVAGREKLYGRTHLSALKARLSLGLVLADIGKSKEAEKELRGIVSTSEAEYGATHMETLEFCYHLAGFLFDLGRMNESQELCARTLENNRKTLGRKHSQSIQCEALLSQIAATVPGRNVSMSAARSVLAKKLEDLGPTHAETLKARMALANQLYSEQHFPEAAKEYEIVVAVYQKQDAMRTKDGIEARIGQAEVARRMGYTAEADNVYRTLRYDCTRYLPENHYLNTQCLGNYALLLKDKGEDQECLKYQEQALTGLTREHGESHPRVARMYLQIADTYRRLGQHDKWKTHMQNGYEISKRSMGEADILTQSFAEALQNPKALEEALAGSTPAKAGTKSDESLGNVLKPVPDPIAPTFIGPGDLPPPVKANPFEELKKRWEQL